MKLETEREVVVGNEGFLIGVLQAVSGGALIAGLSQAEVVIKHAGKGALLLFLTFLAASLLTAVLAAYWRHQYKMWNLKAGVSQARGATAEAVERSANSDRALNRMRRAFAVSTGGIMIAVTILIVAMWRTI